MEKREGAAKAGKGFRSTLFMLAGFENKKFDADEPLPIVYNREETTNMPHVVAEWRRRL